VGAVWIKTLEGKVGRITVAATHASLGAKRVEIAVLPILGH
jgi:hypothetical protein